MIRLIMIVSIFFLAGCASKNTAEKKSDDKSYCWAYVSKAAELRNMKKYSESLELTEEFKSCLGYPAMPYFYHSAWTFYDMQKYKETIESINQGLKYQPKYAWAYWRRGMAYKALGQEEKAKLDFRAAYLIAVKQSKSELYKNIKENPDIENSLFGAVSADERRRVESEKVPRGEIVLVSENYAEIERSGVKYILNTFIVPFEQPYYILVKRADGKILSFDEVLDMSIEYIKPRGCTSPVERRQDIDSDNSERTAVIVGVAC